MFLFLVHASSQSELQQLLRPYLLLYCSSGHTRADVSISEDMNSVDVEHHLPVSQSGISEPFCDVHI